MPTAMRSIHKPLMMHELLSAVEAAVSAAKPVAAGDSCGLQPISNQALIVYHKPVTMHERGHCSRGCLLANAFGVSAASCSSASSAWAVQLRVDFADCKTSLSHHGRQISESESEAQASNRRKPKPTQKKQQQASAAKAAPKKK